MFVVITSILALSITLLLLFKTYQKIRDNEHKKFEKEKTVKQLCPDYWEVNNHEVDNLGNTVSVSCRNVHQLGKCAVTASDIFTFDDELFNDPDTADMAKCKWSKNCGVTWQGYDNLCAM